MTGPNGPHDNDGPDGGAPDGFDAFVRRAAAGYNAPGATPADEMWQVIAARRATTRGVGGSDIAPATPSWRVRRYAPWIGMAATLLLGVGIGRFALERRGDAEQPPVVADATPAPAPASGDTAPSLDAPTPTPTLAITGDAGPRRAATGRPAQTVRTVAATDAPDERDAADAPYSIASRQHLTRAEALIAVVAMSAEDALLDSLTGKWARDILVNTRLLLDSPAGDDPVRRRLLEDLETILVQLVQRTGRVEEDKAMLDRTLQRTQLLTRLRSGAAGT